MKKNDTHNYENHKKGSSNSTQQTAEHVILHAIGYVIAGPIGSLFAGLFHVGTLNPEQDRLIAERHSRAGEEQLEEHKRKAPCPK